MEWAVMTGVWDSVRLKNEDGKWYLASLDLISDRGTTVWIKFTMPFGITVAKHYATKVAFATNEDKALFTLEILDIK